jgi:hypothetical protein
MIRTRKKILGMIIVLAMFFSLAALMPASAKNLKIPADADRVDYIDAGGTVDIALTAPLPAGYPSSATIMRLKFMHVEIPPCYFHNCHQTFEKKPHHQSFDALLVFFYMKLTGATENTWQPFAVITTSQEYATFSETFWSGTLARWDVPSNYPYPAVSTNNIIVVSNDALSVDGWGTCIKVKLDDEQQLMRPTGAVFTLPSFTLNLYKHGAFVHNDETNPMTGWTGASGYTLVVDAFGYNANAVFKSNGALVTGVTSNAMGIMFGTHTYFPPT